MATDPETTTLKGLGQGAELLPETGARWLLDAKSVLLIACNLLASTDRTDRRREDLAETLEQCKSQAEDLGRHVERGSRKEKALKRQVLSLLLGGAALLEAHIAPPAPSLPPPLPPRSGKVAAHPLRVLMDELKERASNEHVAGNIAMQILSHVEEIRAAGAPSTEEAMLLAEAAALLESPNHRNALDLEQDRLEAIRHAEIFLTVTEGTENREWTGTPPETLLEKLRLAHAAFEGILKEASDSERHAWERDEAASLAELIGRLAPFVTHASKTEAPAEAQKEAPVEKVIVDQSAFVPTATAANDGQEPGRRNTLTMGSGGLSPADVVDLPAPKSADLPAPKEDSAHEAATAERLLNLPLGAWTEADHAAAEPLLLTRLAGGDGAVFRGDYPVLMKRCKLEMRFSAHRERMEALSAKPLGSWTSAENAEALELCYKEGDRSVLEVWATPAFDERIRAEAAAAAPTKPRPASRDELIELAHAPFFDAVRAAGILGTDNPFNVGRALDTPEQALCLRWQAETLIDKRETWNAADLGWFFSNRALLARHVAARIDERKTREQRPTAAAPGDAPPLATRPSAPLAAETTTGFDEERRSWPPAPDEVIRETTPSKNPGFHERAPRRKGWLRSALLTGGLVTFLIAGAVLLLQQNDPVENPPTPAPTLSPAPVPAPPQPAPPVPPAATGTVRPVRAADLRVRNLHRVPRYAIPFHIEHGTQLMCHRAGAITANADGTFDYSRCEWRE